jgi:hypothetical protein
MQSVPERSFSVRMDKALRKPTKDGRDTDVGMSHRRLAALLPVFFEPSEPEIEYSTEYSLF